MATFITMVNRIAAELVRSNITDQIKAAINDAVEEGAKNRFYFNEMRAVTFNTVAANEYYSDQGLVGIDMIYYWQGTTRMNMWEVNNIDADLRAQGNIISSGQLDIWSRQGTDLRLFPVPTGIIAIYADGYGKLTPWPLTDDADTNNWMTYGERYIRALAKAVLYKDVIGDFGKATVFEAIAEDYRQSLDEETTERQATGTMQATQF